MANKESNFAENLEKFKKLPAGTQKKAFDAILEEITANSTDKEIASTVKDVVYWVVKVS